MIIARIQRRILHQGSLVHKTMRVGLDLYDDSDTSQEEETVLNWILCSFRSDEWSEGYEEELNHNLGCNNLLLRATYSMIEEQRLIWMTREDLKWQMYFKRVPQPPLHRIQRHVKVARTCQMAASRIAHVPGLLTIMTWPKATRPTPYDPTTQGEAFESAIVAAVSDRTTEMESHTTVSVLRNHAAMQAYQVCRRLCAAPR